MVDEHLNVRKTLLASGDVRTPAANHRRTVGDMRRSLLNTGLGDAEVEAALSAVGAPSGSATWGARAIRKSVTDEETRVVDTHQIFDLLEESSGKTLGVMPASFTSSPRTSNFSTWVERCEALLEKHDEADYVAKKQLSTQVRAFLAARKLQEKRHHESAAWRPRPSRLTTQEKKASSQEGGGAELEGEQMQPAENKEGSQDEGELQDADGGAVASTQGTQGTSGATFAKASTASALEFSAHQLFERMLSGTTRLAKPFVRKLVDRFMHAWDEKIASRTLVTDFRIPETGQMIIVGDLRGQLDDLLTLMVVHGEPSQTVRYLFTGNLVDKGNHGAEIVCLLFAFFVEDPNCIMFTRGNHEDAELNKRDASEGGGFFKECVDKYGTAVFMRLEQWYKTLPLAHILHDEVFVVHGGLARNARGMLSPNYIASIDASQVCCPDIGAESIQDQVFQDLLWSDPTEELGTQTNPRGTGILWGPDITQRFLHRTGLKWIIRSHGVPENRQGWMEHHLGLVFTVFSASNYAGTRQNFGAVAILQRGAATEEAQGLQVRFEEHYAPAAEEGHLKEIWELPDQVARRAALAEAGATRSCADAISVGHRRERAVLAKMAGRVVECRPELLENFLFMDYNNSGLISFVNWTEVVSTVCGEHFPWALGGQRWGLQIQRTCQYSGAMQTMVDYRSFLGRFQIGMSQERWSSWKAILMSDVYEAIFGHDLDLAKTLGLFDANKDGKVSRKEFIEAVSMAIKHAEGFQDDDGASAPLTPAQLAVLTHGLFPAGCSGDEELDVYDFFERFTVIYRQTYSMTGDDPLAEWRQMLAQLGRLLLHQDRDKPRASSCLARANHARQSISKSQKSVLRESVCTRASLVPRPESFSAEGSKSRQMMQIFEHYDHSGDGFLQIDEFVNNLMEVRGIEDLYFHGERVGPKQLRELAETLDKMSGALTGQVNFTAFLDAFMLVWPRGAQGEGEALSKSGSESDVANCGQAEDELYEHILSLLYRHRHALWVGCSTADSDVTGRTSAMEFADVLRSTDVALAQKSRHFTDHQIESLTQALTEEDGCVPYVEFLQALVIKDSQEG